MKVSTQMFMLVTYGYYVMVVSGFLISVGESCMFTLNFFLEVARWSGGSGIGSKTCADETALCHQLVWLGWAGLIRQHFLITQKKVINN